MNELTTNDNSLDDLLEDCWNARRDPLDDARVRAALEAKPERLEGLIRQRAAVLSLESDRARAALSTVHRRRSGAHRRSLYAGLVAVVLIAISIAWPRRATRPIVLRTDVVLHSAHTTRTHRPNHVRLERRIEFDLEQDSNTNRLSIVTRQVRGATD